MAAWQADFLLVLPSGGLPPDYRTALGRLLPPGDSWSESLEVWGTDGGDRIDVFAVRGSAPEVLARFDLREWKPVLYDRFLHFVAQAQGSLQEAETGRVVPLTVEGFTHALRESRAALFVRDPDAYFHRLREQAL